MSAYLLTYVGYILLYVFLKANQLLSSFDDMIMQSYESDCVGVLVHFVQLEL
jgi:hypothetical protein